MVAWFILTINEMSRYNVKKGTEVMNSLSSNGHPQLIDLAAH